MSDGKKDMADEQAANEEAASFTQFVIQDPRMVWRSVRTALDALIQFERSNPALTRGQHMAVDTARTRLRQALGEK